MKRFQNETKTIKTMRRDFGKNPTTYEKNIIFLLPLRILASHFVVAN
jgi:hypothetical protein